MKLLYTFILFFYCFQILSQDIEKSDSIYVLPEVSVLSQSTDTSYLTNTIRSTPRLYSTAESFPQHLYFTNSIAIKNHGYGSLSTYSIRGHASAQTAISIDGFTIQSIMNGVYDLSLIPTHFLATATIDPNGSSSTINGGMGGQIALKTFDYSFPSIPFQFSYLTSFGSYGQFGNYMKFKKSWNKNKIQSSNLNIFHQQAENDFPYNNLNQIGTPKINLTNADFKQYGVQQNNTFELRDKSLFSTKFWYVNNKRGIPTTLTESSSISRQNDELLHGIISWKKEWNEKFKSETNARVLYEHIYFESPAVTTDSKAFKWEGRNSIQYRINKNHLISNITGVEYSTANVEDYQADQPSQIKPYTQLTYQFKNKHYNFSFHAKEEYLNQKFSPFAFQLNAGYTKNQKNNLLYFYGSFSREFRAPTFNDLFWESNLFVSGNPDLTPEKGWKNELGVNYQLAIKRQLHDFRLTSFFSSINDWILWAPNLQGTWIPENLKKVNSRGIEIVYNTTLSLKNQMTFYSELNYQFTKTTNQQTISSNTAILNKQLIYVPLHTGTFNFHFMYKEFTLLFGINMTGKRYTTTDNSVSIPKFIHTDLEFKYQLSFNKYNLTPIFQIKNLFNNSYQNVANRPMPPIHFVGKLKFTF